jgi:hypothetical protein
MQPRVMITNGGVHTADKWAAVTAAEIADLIEISEASTSPEAIAARKAKPRLELDIADLVERFHANVQKHERELLAANGDAQLVTPLDPAAGDVDTPEEVVAGIVALTAKTPFAAHFATPEVQAVLKKIVGNHFSLSMDIERSTWADKNVDTSETAKAYRQARADHGPRNAHLHLGQFDKGARGHAGARQPAAR